MDLQAVGVVNPLELIVAQIDTTRPVRGRQIVAIDGVGASGKSTFALELAARMTDRPVVLLHVDDFFNPAPVRHARGRHSPEGFWLDTYDYEALTVRALDPLKTGKTSYRASRAGGTMATAPDAIVLVEGTFLHRDQIRAYWDFSIYLHVPFSVAAERMAARGTISSIDDPLLERYFGAQRLYFEQARPRDRASIVLDNSDFDHPSIVTTDQ